MTDTTEAKPLTPQELELHFLITRSRTTTDLIEALDRLTPEQRTLAGKALPRLRRRATPGLEHRYILLAVVLDIRPVQVVTTLHERSVALLADDGPALRHVVERLAARDEYWRLAFIDAALGKLSLVEFVSPLLDPLVDTLGLPFPEEPRYWRGWMRNHSMPTRHRRWERRFIAACAAPNAFTVPQGDRTSYVETVARHIRDLRAAEPVDDRALLRALLQVFARGDRSSAQRVAMMWLEGLGLIGLLPAECTHVAAALPGADSTFAKLAAGKLLGADLTDAGFADLAVGVLPRKETGLKRSVLRILTRVTAPSQDLLDTIRWVAAGTDTTSATLARKLLTQWDKPLDDTETPGAGHSDSPESSSSPGTGPGPLDAEEAEAPGPWRSPAGHCPQPLRHRIDVVPVLDRNSLLKMLTQIDADHRNSPGLQEHALAALIATAYVRGAAQVKHAIRSVITHSYTHNSTLHRFLKNLGGRRDTTPLQVLRSAPLTFLVMQRVADALNRLGELPCLLSTPTHTGFHVAWEGLAARIHRYRHARVKVLPTDVAVTLARLDRSTTPGDLSPFAHPIHGVAVDLATVIRYWRDHPARPGRLRHLPIQNEQRENLPFTRLEADGDEPTVHKLLGLRNSWTLPYKPTHTYQEDPWVLVLLPEHPARPASLILRASGTLALTFLERIATTAPTLGPVATFAALTLASNATPQERERVAALILTAWDEERLTPDDLVAAWHDPWRATWEISIPRLTETLGFIADAGGLALVWPLLTTISEEIAALPKVLAPSATALELLLHYLPDALAAGAAVDLPNVARLATRPSTTRAARTAQLIMAAL